MNNARTLDVATKTFPKTDSRYWKDKLFKRTNDEWQVQVAYAGRQERFPLKTANKDTGAANARDIYFSLNAAGWEATLAKFKPWTTEPKDDSKPLTVGDFIDAIRAVAPVR